MSRLSAALHVIITTAAWLSLTFVVHLLLQIQGSVPLVVWPQFLAVFSIAVLFLVFALRRFRRIAAASIA
jgi:hypothetical protein